MQAKVYHVATAQVLWPAVHEYLQAIDATSWQPTGNKSPGEALVEIGGRLCYRSFAVGLNPNVTGIREGNKAHIANLLAHVHGSVFEHVNDTFILHKVSRVLTHELVRHRHCAFSQESLRYFRVSEVQLYWPVAFDEVDEKTTVLGKWIQHAARTTGLLSELYQLLRLDSIASFKLKKRLTSALRRLIPMGQLTTIMITTNQWQWRYMIERRTSSDAEEEIREVFLDIFHQLREAHPNIYQDGVEHEDGSVTFGRLNEGAQ